MKRLVFIAILLGAGVAHAQDAATQQLLQEADKNYDSGDYERAASNFDRAIGAQPKDVPATAYAKRASIFLFAKKYEDGLRWITDVAERSWPGDDAILEQKAIILSRIPDRKKEAIDLAETVVKRRPQVYTLQILLGDFNYGLGAAAAAPTATHYEAYLASRPADLAANDGLVRVKLGFTYLHVARFSDAEKQFDEVVRSFSSDGNLGANARKGQCAAYAGEQNWDRALTVCERVIADKKALAGDASPQYNVGLAYLNRDRLDEALKAADAYLALKPKEPRGYLLRAEVHLRRGKLELAETQLNIADQIAPNDPEVARDLGRVYLRQKRPQKAIDKLVRVLAARPGDVETIAVCAEAYIAAGQGDNAVLQAEKGLRLPGQEKNVRLLGLVGEGYYVAGKLPEARNTLMLALAAGKERGAAVDVRLRSLVVDTINRQAAVKWKANDLPGAEALLLEARALDAESTRTTFNLGLCAVERGRYPEAIAYLSVRLAKTPQDMLTNRLIARAYLGAGDTKQAAAHYATAAAEANARRDLPLLAEIYTEWAPILIASGGAGTIDDAVAKLEQAVPGAQGQPFEKATRRNLQLAYFKRGTERLRARRTNEAVADLEGAVRDPSVLVGHEEDAFDFALGLAYLDAGQDAKASAIFQTISKKANNGPLAFLKPPFDTVGADFFAAYTLYREGTAASRAKAAALLDHLLDRKGGSSGAFGAKLRELQRSTWEFTAYDAYAHGQPRDAEAALKKASVLATADKRAPIDLNTAVLDMDKNGAAARAVFQRLADRLPEALVNLGILADRDGDARAAYDDFTTARSKGARSPHLDEWIDAKKRFFGF